MWLKLGALLGRYWPYVAAILAAIAAYIAFQLVYAKLDAATAQRDKALTQLSVSNASIKDLQGSVIAQNAAVAAMNADSERRLMEGRALILEEVRKGTKAVQVASQLANKPKSDGDQAKTSDTVMANRGLL